MLSASIGEVDAIEARRDVESLRQDALNTLNIGLFLLAVGWVAITLMIPDGPFFARIMPAGLFVVSGLCFALSRNAPGLARYVFLLGLLSLLIGYLAVETNTLAVFFAVPIVVIASVITSGVARPSAHGHVTTSSATA